MITQAEMEKTSNISSIKYSIYKIEYVYDNVFPYFFKVLLPDRIL